MRCIDDVLVGEQNSTVGTISTHRPTDPGGLVAQVRAVRERYPREKLRGSPCDLEKAYKQVPNFPALMHLTVISTWSPELSRAVLFIAMCQLFGGRSPPLNFARYLAWLVEVAAVLFALPLTHCVDDIIGVEPSVIAVSGNLAFKILCEYGLGGFRGEGTTPDRKFRRHRSGTEPGDGT